MTLEELTTPATKEEVEEAIYASLAAKGSKTTTWKPGAVTKAIITGVSIVLAALSVLVALIAAGGFLELAKNVWLTLVARHVYGVERIPETFATSTVTVQNTGGGVYAGDPDDLVFSASGGTAEGKTYRNTGAFSIPAMAGSVEIPVQAVEAGSASTAAVDEIDTLETALLGVIVTSSTAAVGADEETDAALRTRCRAKTGTLSPNGPRDAYHYVALSAKRQDGTSIGVTRVLTQADGNGNVDVYVADGSGDIPGDVADPATDLGAIAEAIHTQTEPLAVTPSVQSATPFPVNVAYTLWVYDTSGLSDGEIEVLANKRLLDFLASLPIGGVVKATGVTGRVYVDALEAVIAGTLPDQLIDVEVTTPGADVDLAIPEAPILGTPAGTIEQVPTGAT